MSVRLRFGARDEKMDAVRTLVHPVVVPRIGPHDFAHAVFRLRAVYARHPNVSTDDFKDLDVFRTALAPERMTALCLGGDAQLDEYVAKALFPTDQVAVRQDARCGND